jgi:hypothetical protein
VQSHDIRDFASELATCVIQALPEWVVRTVVTIAEQQGVEVEDRLLSTAEAEGVGCQSSLGPKILAYLDTKNSHRYPGFLPWIGRRVVPYPTNALRSVDVPVVDAERSHNVYGIEIRHFKDLSPDAHRKAFLWATVAAHLNRDPFHDSGLRDIGFGPRIEIDWTRISLQLPDRSHFEAAPTSAHMHKGEDASLSA